MKTKILLFVGILSFAINSVAQGSLPPSICSEFKPSGWIFFNPGTINFGGLFTTHKPCFFGQAEDSMEVIREWDDNILNFHHIRYQQKYMGIEVEGCEFIEHGRNENGLVYANGKICPDIHKRYSEKTISEEDALDAILLANPFVQFAWENPLWESSLQTELGDSLATYYPVGELVFSIHENADVQYLMDPIDYSLAWRFDILISAPYAHCIVYVDALTGNIIRMYNPEHNDGPADIPGHGSKTLDTKERGFPNNDWILDTDNGSRKVHTKLHGAGGAWTWTSEVDDNDDNWGSSNQLATAPHWMVSRAWDYFTDVWGREGMEPGGNVVRVRTDHFVDGARYDKVFGANTIYVGHLSSSGHYAADLAIMAHEFSHGVDQSEGKLEYWSESGALDESFADIFGFLCRRWETGSTSWIIGVPGSNPRDQRNMSNPNSLGVNYFWNGTMDSILSGDGQPDTYGGTYWFDTGEGTDAGGVHVNSGVMNYWFYLLSQGGIGVNDLGNSYTINGIGIDKAAEITYYNFVNNMEKESQYEDAMEGAITTALLLYGECSFEHIETQNAWYAVGLGNWSACIGAGFEELNTDLTIYPNPTQDYVTIKTNDNSIYSVEIFELNGKLISTYNFNSSNVVTIDLNTFSSGTYILKINGVVTSYKKVIKK